MANLIVQFGRTDTRRGTYVPLMVGSQVRTEELDIAASGPSEGALTASATENVVRLTALADCYVAIGSDPDPEVSAARWYLTSGWTEQFDVSLGDKVAVIGAA